MNLHSYPNILSALKEVYEDPSDVVYYWAQTRIIDPQALKMMETNPVTCKRFIEVFSNGYDGPLVVPPKPVAKPKSKAMKTVNKPAVKEDE